MVPRRQAFARVDIRVLASAVPHTPLYLDGLLVPKTANHNCFLRVAHSSDDFPIVREVS